MELQLKITGVLLLALALLHACFPRYFKWGDELANISLLTRQVFYVHMFFIAFIVFLMGLLCISSGQELTGTPLGQKIAGGLFIFWLCRLLIQVFGYSPALWRGKGFETIIHLLFILLWSYLTLIFGLTAFSLVENDGKRISNAVGGCWRGAFNIPPARIDIETPDHLPKWWV